MKPNPDDKVFVDSFANELKRDILLKRLRRQRLLSAIAALLQMAVLAINFMGTSRPPVHPMVAFGAALFFMLSLHVDLKIKVLLIAKYLDQNQK